MNFVRVGSQIRKFRRRANLTQEELAERVSSSVQYIGYLENGRRGAKLETIIGIANVLDITVNLLLQSYLDCDVTAHVCEFEELISNLGYDERDEVLDGIYIIIDKLLD